MNLNDKIKNHSSDINPEEVWSAIEPRVKELNKKRKNRSFFWIFMTTGVIALSVFLIGKEIIQHQRGSSENLNIDLVQEKNNIADGSRYVNKINETPNSINSNEIISEDIEKRPSTDEYQSDDISSQKGQSLNQKSETTELISENNTEQGDLTTKSYYTASSKSELASNKSKNKLELIIKPSEKGINQSSSSKLYIGTHSKVNSNSIIEINSNTNSDNGPHPSSSIYLNEERNKHDLLNAQNHREISSIDLHPQLTYIPTSMGMIQGLIMESPGMHKQKSIDIGLRLYGGASFVTRSMSSSNADWNDYLEIRERTESVLESTHFGADLLMRHKSGFNISFGIQRTQINERFDLNTSVTDTTTSIGVKYLVLNLMGDTTPVEGELQNITTTSTRYKIYNKYRLIEIPVSVGYSFRKNGWSLGAQAGILLNLSLNANGSILNENGDVTKIEDIPDLYPENIGIGSFFGISIQRKLGKRFALSLNSNIKFYPNLYNSSYGLSSKYTLIGMDLGVIYIL